MNNGNNKSTTDNEVSDCDKDPCAINKDEKPGDEDDDDDDEDDEEWLEKLGLDKKHYQSRDTSISAKKWVLNKWFSAYLMENLSS